MTLITIALAGLLVSVGMAGYAKVQRWCFIGGMVGFAVMVILLLIDSHADFIAAFNREGQDLFGVHNAYAATNAAAVKAGYTTSSFGFGPLGPTMLLVPAMMFFLLWPNWGTTLYGEVRGASDFKRVFAGMFFGLWITVILTVIFLLLMAKTVGWGFYQNLNSLDYNVTPQFGIWPYPFMFAGWLVHNTAFQVVLILVLSLWFFGWVGTLFLSSTRVIFAAAFDRVLPDRAAEVSERRRVPVYSLLLMLLPAVGLAAMYAYNTDVPHLHAGRHTGHRGDLPVQRDRRGDLAAAQAGPVVRLTGQQGEVVRRAHRAGGRGDHDRAARVQPLRVAVERPVLREQASSLIYMGAMYVLAIVIFVGARIIRNRQGIDLSLINKEIPVE